MPNPFTRASSWFASMPSALPLGGRGAAILWGLGGLLAALTVWSLSALHYNNSIVLPPPWEVLQSIGSQLENGTLLRDIGSSVSRVFGGFAIAVGIAVPLALLMAAFKPLRYLVLPVLTLLRPIPPIAWIPIAILWFGISNRSSYFITTLAAFFPIFINSLTGGLAVEAQHLHAAKCLGAGRWLLLRRVFLPSALPSIWTGLKIGLGQAWMAVITAELIAAQSGLGYMIQLNRLQMETPSVLLGMAIIGLLGAAMASALGYLERFILPWTNHTK